MENQIDNIVSENVTPDKVLPLEWIIAISVCGGIISVVCVVGIAILLRRLFASNLSKIDNNEETEDDKCRIIPCRSRYSSTSDTSPPYVEEFIKPRLSLALVQPKAQYSRYHRLSLPSIIQAETSESTDDDEAGDKLFGDSKGRIWFSVKFDEQLSRLSITIIKARFLKGLNHDARDPFVRVYVLPDEENFQQTKCRRRTLSPRFNETLSFHISPSEIRNKTLKITVYDIDRRRVRHTLGYAVVPVTKIDLANEHVMCRDLDTTLKKPDQVGELFFSLCVNSYTHRIKVAIFKGRDFLFKHIPITEPTELFIRTEFYYCSKLVKWKDTIKQKFSENPNFYQNFSFSVVGRHFDSYSITFNVILCTGERHIKCARVSVGSLLYSHGNELKHWQDMMLSPQTPVERWHFLTLVT